MSYMKLRVIVLCLIFGLAQYVSSNADHNVKFSAVLLNAVSDVTNSSHKKVGCILENSNGELFLATDFNSFLPFQEEFTLVVFSQADHPWDDAKTSKVVLRGEKWRYCPEGIALLQLKTNVADSDKQQLKNIALRPKASSVNLNLDSFKFTQTFLDMYSVAPLPSSLRCVRAERDLIATDNFDAIDQLNEAYCLGVPVFNACSTNSTSDFCGIVVNKQERVGQYLKSDRLAKLIGEDFNTLSTVNNFRLPKIHFKPVNGDLITLRDQLAVTFLKLDKESGILVCPTKAVAEGISLSENEKLDLTVELELKQFASNASWTHTDFALSLADLSKADCSSTLWSRLESIAFEESNIHIPISDRKTTLFLGLPDPIYGAEHVKALECQTANIANPTNPLMLNVTTSFEKIRIGLPVYRIGKSGAKCLEGIVYGILPYKDIDSNAKNVTCCGRVVPIDFCLGKIRSPLRPDTPVNSKSNSAFLRRYFCMLSTGSEPKHGCIIKSNTGRYYFITAKHALSSSDEPFELHIIHDSDTDNFFTRYIQIPFASAQWIKDESDVAAFELVLTALNSAEREAVKNAAIDVDLQKSSQEPKLFEEFYTFTSWRDELVIHQGFVCSPTFTNPIRDGGVFALYPGMLRGSSGSPIFALDGLVPELVGVLSAGITENDSEVVSLNVPISNVLALISTVEGKQ